MVDEAAQAVPVAEDAAAQAESAPRESHAEPTSSEKPGAATENNKGTEGEEEEEETCGFCKFMKGGACKDVFVAWEACVDSCRDKDGGDFVENCLNQTKSLKDCMEENAEYYGIMLQAEEESLAAKEEAAEKMAAEGEAAAEGDRPKEED